MKRKFKIALFLLAGLATGVALSELDFPGYEHAMVIIRRGAAKPLYLSGSGRQVLALSLRNLTKSSDIEIRMGGGEVESWFPPVIRMPFNNGGFFKDGKFGGVKLGDRLPVYVSFNDNGEKRKVEIIDLTDGSLIQAIGILKGTGDERHH